MLSAPSGTITFLFTDIEGSTRRWERDRVAMADALERHDAALREAIEAHGGYVFKTVGDAFCAAFASAGDAVKAALAISRGLQERDFRAVDGIVVRIAIHTGSADTRDGDYFGPTVNRVARLLSIAHGGQVLLSGTAAALVPEDSPDDVALVDLGEHYLKDLGRPERVHQLRAPGLRTDFPPLRSVGIIPNNIPAYGSTFVGREREVADVTARLATARGITLCGIGGIGKTRCALESAKASVSRFRQGVWYVEFAPLGSGESVVGAIDAAIGHEPSSAPANLEALCARLKNSTVLLVLDNCEHLVAAVAPVVDTLLRTCRDISIIATSREPLGYRGESIYRLPPLAFPSEGEDIQPESARSYDAVALFVERAGEVDAGFGVTSETLPIILSVCRRLDGIALAIELAAMRLRAISLTQLEAGLRARFRLLTGGSRTALPRHKTMRALIDWSYELLDADESRLFRGLSVFADGFTLDGCEAVDAGADADGPDVLDLVTSLVDKSLVSLVSEGSSSPSRYRLIETLREYAFEKLVQCGETEARHEGLARWALDIVGRAHTRWVTDATDTWEAAFRPEIENVRAAIEWALARPGDPALGIALVTRARRMFGALAPADGLRLTSLARGLSTTDEEAAAEIELALAQLNIALRRPAAALQHANLAYESLEARGRDEFAHEAQIVAGYANALLGRPNEAKLQLESAQRYFERMHLSQFCGIVASDLGVTHMLAGDLDAARVSFDRALSAFRLTNNERGIRAVVTNLAELDFQAGDVEAAIERIAADLSRSSHADALMLSNLAAYLVAADRFDLALEYARESLITAEASRREVDTWLSIQHVAAALADMAPDPTGADRGIETAAKLTGYVDARLAADNATREFTERQEYERLLAALRQRLGLHLGDFLQIGARLDDRSAIDLAMHT